MSMLRGLGDEEESGKETEREQPVGRRRKMCCPGIGVKGSMCQVLLISQIRTED